MKICFFSSARSLHTRRVASGLAERGHEVQIVCHQPVPIPGVTVVQYEIPPWTLGNARRWEDRKARYLKQHLRTFDVVIVYFLHDWKFTADILDEGCLIASPAGSDITTPPGADPVSEALVQHRVMMLRYAACVGVIGPRFGRMVADYADLNVEDIKIMSLGVDVDQFAQSDGASSSKTPGRRVGFFRGFRPVYGALDLIRAIPYVLSRVPEARFDLVGDGPDLSECIRLADELCVDHAVTWMPKVKHGQVPSMLARWDIMAMPSICESFGVAALEASAMRLPVVASNVGGIPDVIRDGETGVLVPPRSPEKLAEAISTLLLDTPRSLAMGSAGREYVRRNHGWSKALDQWEQTCEETLERQSVMV